jgi:hypothetical protein
MDVSCVPRTGISSIRFIKRTSKIHQDISVFIIARDDNTAAVCPKYFHLSWLTKSETKNVCHMELKLSNSGVPGIKAEMRGN